MSNPTPPSIQATAQKMQTFIDSFHKVVDDFGGYDKAMLGGGFIPSPHPFSTGWERPMAFGYAQYIIRELKQAEEPRLLRLEPLCNIDDEEVQRVGDEDMGLVMKYKACKADVRAWRKQWYLRLDNVFHEYGVNYLDMDPEGEELKFFIHALEEADAKDLSFVYE